MADLPVDDEARLAGLLARAFRTCSAREANDAIDEVRGDWFPGGRAFSYEVVLSEGRRWSYLSTGVAPPLARFLRTRRMRVDACAPVFLSIFAGDTLYFVGAEDFFAYYRQVEDLGAQALLDRAQVWENETQ